MSAGCYFGSAVGRAAVLENERRGTFTWPDVWLGFEGVNLGTAISKNIGGNYFMEIDNVGDWMENRLGE